MADFKVIFYDRKNQREVSHDQLMPINFMESTVVADTDDRKRVSGLNELYVKEVQLGNIGYKDEDGTDYENFDRWLLESDLIFLRLEFIEQEDDVCQCHKTTCPDCRDEVWRGGEMKKVARVESGHCEREAYPECDPRIDCRAPFKSFQPEYFSTLNEKDAEKYIGKVMEFTDTKSLRGEFGWRCSIYKGLTEKHSSMTFMEDEKISWDFMRTCPETFQKRIVKKTVECWANIYDNHPDHKWYTSQFEADTRGFDGRIACVKLTGTYEVEE